MKILITGATGFIGKHLIKDLIHLQYDIHCIVRLNSNLLEINSNVKIFKYNQNVDELIKYFKKEEFDGIIHLASLFLTSHTPNDIQNLISSNIKFGIELLEACKKTNVKWFINTGTFWQNYKNENYNPVNLYAATKEAFQNISKFYTQTSNLIFTTIKLNDTFGPDDTRNKIFNLWHRIIKNNETLEMTAGEQIIDISYIEDVISAYKILIKDLNSNNKEFFNNKEFVITNNEKIKLKELSKLFEEATNSKLNIIWDKKPYKEREVMIPYNKGCTIPNWSQKYSLKEAIKKTLEIN